MHITAAGIRCRLQEQIQNRCMLGQDIRTLNDAYDLIGHLVERIEELETTPKVCERQKAIAHELASRLAVRKGGTVAGELAKAATYIDKD